MLFVGCTVQSEHEVNTATTAVLINKEVFQKCCNMFLLNASLLSTD